MSAKQYLKAAKQALQEENPEYCVQLANDALQLEPENYFAHVFIGKSYHLLGKLKPAESAYKKAIKIDYDSSIAWKGLLLLLKNSSDYKEFFEFAADYAEYLVYKQEPLADFLKDIRLYLKKYDNQEVKEVYLKSLLPENKLGRITEGIIEPPQKVISEYLDILLKRENMEISQKVARARMSNTNSNTTDSISWDIYKDSAIAHLYEELINVLNDDDERRKTEEEYLRYRTKVLKVAPSDLKPEIFVKLREWIEGLVLVKHSSYLAWSTYFDWIDIEDLNLITSDVIKTFLSLFPGEPLAQIFRAFVLSELSTHNIKLDSKNKKSSPKPLLDSQDSQELSVEEQDLLEDNDDFAFSPEELLMLIKQNLDSCKTSLIAHRIALSYQIYLKQFSDGLPLAQDGIQLLVSAKKNTGFSFKNTKEDFLVNYGVILTYHEAPKNFKRALELFDSILVESPRNVKALVGKGSILAERGDLEKAKELLSVVVQKFPNHFEAHLELSWVQIKLGELSKGREGLLQVLNDLKGNTLYILDLKSSVNWKIAQSYLSEGEVEKAYQHLIESLRSSSNYAPSYTSLGEIYINHYDDKKRAIKCFLKAFEIDPSEVTAAYHLVSQFTESGDWIRAESFSTKLISSENGKRRLGSNSWPYRVIGSASLEEQDEAKAVEWFQNAIRIDPSDVESWVGLGEAYTGCGRLEASVKVFRKALELEPDHWVAKYLLGTVQSEIGEHEESIEILENLLKERPEEECIISSLYDALLQYANYSVLSGFFGKAVGLSLKTVDILEKGNKCSSNFWKTTSDLITIFLQIQSKIEKFPHEQILLFLKESTIDINEELIQHYLESKKYVDLVALFLVYSNKAALSLNPTSRPLRSSTLYNLGLSQVIAYLKTHNKEYRDSAIDSLKEAIKLQNNYVEAWVALGVASISVNPRVSQHCLIKATAIDPKNVEIWSNLALLYLRYGDSSLASEAYMRGQSLAPTEPISWLGHALANEAEGNLEEAANLFTHAFVLANGRSPAAQLSYAVSVCLKRIGKGDDIQDIEALQELSTASFGMIQYLKHYPTDTFGLSVTCLILERLNDYDLGKELSTKLLTILETTYEETEDDLVLASFVRVKAQYARFELGLQNYQAAIESSIEALELAQDENVIISSRTVLGLSYFFLDKFDESLEEFKEILSISGDTKRLVVLIAQVLYVYDTEETRQAALDQLFTNIEEKGSSLLVTLVIGAISVIENLEDYLVIIKSELDSLPLTELIEDRFKNVPYLLSEINKKLQANEQSVWQRSAFYFPDDLRVWNHLDENIALKIAGQGKVTAQDLSNAYIPDGNITGLQRSLFLAPWNEPSQKALQQLIE